MRVGARRCFGWLESGDESEKRGASRSMQLRLRHLLANHPTMRGCCLVLIQTERRSPRRSLCRITFHCAGTAQPPVLKTRSCVLGIGDPSSLDLSREDSEPGQGDGTDPVSVRLMPDYNMSRLCRMYKAVEAGRRALCFVHRRQPPRESILQLSSAHKRFRRTP